MVADLLDSRLRVERLLADRSRDEDAEISRLVRQAERAGVRAEWLAERELSGVADTATPQGIVAVVRIPQREWPRVRPLRILVLDGVQDPGNVGTLLRTAEAMGIHGVVCLPGTADPWNPKVVRAAAGSSFRLPVIATGWEEASTRLRDAGATIWAADPSGEPLLRGVMATSGFALVLGNEASGVSPEVLAAVDRRVSVPMAGRVESLNVAVAGAILMDRLLGGEAAARVEGGGDGVG